MATGYGEVSRPAGSFGPFGPFSLNASALTSTPLRLTFSFLSDGPADGEGRPGLDYVGFSGLAGFQARSAIAQALQEFAALAKIQIVYAGNDNPNATLQFSLTDNGPASLGLTTFRPGQAELPLKSYISFDDSIDASQPAWLSAIRYEIGKAFGLAGDGSDSANLASAPSPHDFGDMSAVFQLSNDLLLLSAPSLEAAIADSGLSALASAGASGFPAHDVAFQFADVAAVGAAFADGDALAAALDHVEVPHAAGGAVSSFHDGYHLV